MRDRLMQPPSVWTLITSLLSRVRARLTWHLKYSDVLTLKVEAWDLQVAVLSLPALKPRLQEIRWLLLSLNSSACARVPNRANSAMPEQNFTTWFILVIPIGLLRTPAFDSCVLEQRARTGEEDSREVQEGKSQSL